MKLSSLIITFFVLGFSGLAFSEQVIDIPLQPGGSYQVKTVPTGYSFKVSCEGSSTPVVVPPPPPLTQYRCAIVYNGGPAEGVKGGISRDLCEAARSALRACRARLTGDLATTFCAINSRFYGNGAKCKDDSGNQVSASNCL